MSSSIAPVSLRMWADHRITVVRPHAVIAMADLCAQVVRISNAPKTDPNDLGSNARERMESLRRLSVHGLGIALMQDSAMLSTQQQRRSMASMGFCWHAQLPTQGRSQSAAREINAHVAVVDAADFPEQFRHNPRTANDRWQRFALKRTCRVDIVSSTS